MFMKLPKMFWRLLTYLANMPPFCLYTIEDLATEHSSRLWSIKALSRCAFSIHSKEFIDKYLARCVKLNYTKLWPGMYTANIATRIIYIIDALYTLQIK